MNTETTTEPLLIPPRVMVDGKLYWRNTAGHLVPAELVAEIDAFRNDTVMEIAQEIEEESRRLSAKKAKWMSDVLTFIQLSGEKYGVEVGGQKGNTTISSYDGAYRVQIAVQTRVVFDERLRLAQQLLEEYFQELTNDIPPEIRVFVQEGFAMDAEGQIRASGVLALQKYAINAPKWRRAMELIMLAIDRQTSGTYLRVSKRDKDGKFRMVPLFSTNVATA